MFEVGQSVRFKSHHGGKDDNKVGTIVKVLGNTYFYVYLPEGYKHKKGRNPSTMVNGVRKVFTWQCSARFLERISTNRQLHFQFD